MEHSNSAQILHPLMVSRLPEGLTEIGKEAFQDCTGLTSLGGLPESLAKVGKGAFRGCTGVTSTSGLPSSFV